ncbi:MAG: hypothetical protein AVDCRST_MAG59-3138 [uncultured Thermomicrobiales bacterium]|uniref:3-oxoacyl-[acyl-carrier-protein] reductase n=1 Tax=uncultured Thermomicrobiales bacterium TaxID=1645740 RepID=A0A6J4V4Q7_9BACT|nr:MAG: hypothetical protein AVDCRST_MAG59-3138 [uncultured Thermomicrobiales bacterium]
MGDSELPLHGLTALVARETRGLRRVNAEWLGRDGRALLISRRLPPDVERAVGELPGLGLAADGIVADLANPTATHRLGRKATARRSLHLLVNNAGMSIRGPFWDMSHDDREPRTNVNQGARFIIARHAAGAMIGTGIRGRIVDIGTIGARHCHKNALVYDAAKAAVEAITRTRPYEWGPSGVSVNCLVPGAIGDRPGERPIPSAARKPPPSNPSDGPVGRRTSPPPSATSAVPSPPGRRGNVCWSTAAIRRGLPRSGGERRSAAALQRPLGIRRGA